MASAPTVLHETLVHALKYNAEHTPDHTIIRWVNNSCRVEASITYQKLLEQSELVAHLLLQNGVQRGDRIMIAYPFGLDFLSGLFGCMRVGAIACSVYPPNFIDKSKARFSFEQFNNQVRDAGAKYALSTSKFKLGLKVALVSSLKTSVKWLATDKLKPQANDPKLGEVELSSSDIAFIQYSSGSTGTPKGIVLSHGAVMHNIITGRGDMEMDQPGNVGVTWLPQYHDYALIVFYVGPCFAPPFSPVYACSPIDFILNPILWADMMDTFRATHIAGPNFAFGLLARRMEAAGRQLKQPVRVLRANIAAEPIAPKTLEDMAAIGIPKNAINPSYGLAEVCAAATSIVGEEVKIHDGVVSSGLLARNERFGKHIVIANNDTIVNNEEIGEIFLRGPDLASGYWQKPELDDCFRCKLSDGEHYFATGDLGQIVDGRLYVVGRLKELIIVNGKNIYPQDIERVIEAEYPTVVRPGSTVAFQRTDADIGIALEIRKTVKSLDDVSGEFSVASIQRLVNDACGVKIGDIKLLKQGAVPKTTSGKLRRVDCRRSSLEGSWPANKLLQSVQEAVSSLEKEDSEAGAEATIKSIVGQDIIMTSDWESNGLTSLMHAELVDRVREVHLVTLPTNFQQTCPSPAALKAFIEAADAQQFRVELSNLLDKRSSQDMTPSLSRTTLNVLQGVGILLLLLVFVACLIPSYFVGKVTVHLSTTIEIADSGRYVTLAWLPVVVPTFFATFSLVVLAFKWILIWRYKSTIIDIPSVSYLRWWFVDRLLDLWEIFVGSFVVNTKIIWAFYRLMGARLSWSCQVDGFIREFDLVTVEEGSSIEHQIRCRKFTTTTNKEGSPSLVFRPIHVDKCCTIKGMLAPGVHVGASSMVDRYAAVAEGSQLSECVLVKGSPAFNAGPFESCARERGYWMVEFAKVLLLLVELYHFFSLFVLAQVLLNEQLPPWRYSPLLYWILLLPLTSAIGMITSIILKWVMIGRRRPGTSNVFRRVAHWFCDYHFGVAAMTLFPLIGMSRLWNAILFLHGLNVDFVSFLNEIFSFPPSKVDFIRIRRSFLSTIRVEAGDYIEIVDTTIGYNVEIRPGVKIHRSVIPPRHIVDESMYDANFQSQVEKNSTYSIFDQVAMEFVFPFCALLIAASFIPSYELFIDTVASAPAGLSIPWLALIVVVQCVTWVMVEKLVQSIVPLFHQRARNIIYPSYLLVAWQNRAWNILIVCCRGTVFIRYWLLFMGAQVNGDLWYFGNAIYDLYNLKFEDKTIVDDAHVAGHYVVYGNVSLKNTRIMGVVHPGTYCPAGAELTGLESGPWKVYLGGSETKDGLDDTSERRFQRSFHSLEYSC